jgi:phosphoenolpyruvate synthase/pyruvate phosphate dikinase
MDKPTKLNNTFHEFDRSFFKSTEDFSVLGNGSMGGKAAGLAFIKNIIKENIEETEFSNIEITIPRLVVLQTDLFDSFMERNSLYEIANSGETDEKIASEFQKASLPTEILGDLRSLIAEVHTPLAIRSSSMLEDAKFEPFAGIYSTKMIANNEFSTDDRFNKLVEAIKFVYASTFFKDAKDYLLATKLSSEDEKMAVIIQEVIGSKYNDKFYPQISGVARSYNFYPVNKTKPEDGVVNLALGLGKQIVDGGISWVYSPARPKSSPPFANDLE